MDATRHTLLDNKVQVYIRPGTPHWQCACSIGGKQRRSTTKEESLARAKDVARDWYLTLLGKYKAGGLRDGKTFQEAADRFMDEYETLNRDQRSAIYIKAHRDRLKNHLKPFFGEMVLSEITAGRVQDYRIHRTKTGLSRLDQFKLANWEKAKAEAIEKAKKKGLPPPVIEPLKEDHKPPARSSLHQEIVCLRQVLKFANRHGWLEHLPNLSSPYSASSKISHRAWFSPEEYITLYTKTGKLADEPPSERLRWAYEQLHDFVLFMANTGLRPDEALRLQFRDVEVEKDEATKKTILVITVRGKRGVGYCKSRPNAVEPFRRLEKRRRPTRVPELSKEKSADKANAPKGPVLTTPQPTDLVFPKTHRDLLRDILIDLELDEDREGNPRTSYSLRHTYISMRLSEGADIYQIAKNCRTSVEMIEKYYASHIKNRLDTAAINVERPKPKSSKRKAKSEGGEARP
ncbi:MAG: hypothetical protein WDM86_08735 [Rhizomicrobium sp.]